MAKQQTIKYAPQWNNMTVDNVTFQTNNVVGNFNYPPNVPAYKPIMKFLLNCPLKKAFTNCPSVVYQNFFREFCSTVVSYDPFPSTDETEQRPLREFLIKLIGQNYHQSELTGQNPSPEELLSCGLENSIHFCDSGSDYTQVENFRFLPSILSNFNFTKDPSKVTNIELTAHMIDVNNHKDSVSPLPLATMPKKGKSHTMTPTLPKLQGLEVPRALSKKSKRPKSKKPPTKTNVTPPKPTEGSKQSHSVSSGTVPDPQDLERNIQLASTGLPSTLDEGTCKSQPLPESSATPPKDLGGNVQPLDIDLTSMTFSKGTAKTTPHVRAFLLSNDEAQESEEDILGAGEETQDSSIAETHHQSPPPQEDKPQSSHVPSTEASDTDSSSDNIIKKYDNILPLTKRQLDDLKASIDDYYDENIAHRDQTNKLVEASMSSLYKSSNTISYLYKGLNIITELLKEIKNAVKDDSVINKKINEATELFTKFSTNITDLYVTPTLALTYIPENVEGENVTNTATKEPPSHTERETEHPKMAVPILSIQPTQAQPITTITTHPKSSQTLQIDKGKGIVTESDENSSKKLVTASSIIRPDPDEEKASKEERLLAISKPEVIKVVQEEAEKIGLDPKKIKSAKAGEKFKKAQDAEHQVLKRENTEKVRKSLELRKHKFENYMWTINNKLKPETIIDIKIYLKTKPVVITVYRGTDGRNFDVHKPFAFGAFGLSELDELREIIPKKKNAVVQDLMNLLSRRYERIRKIPEELGIKSALPAPVPAPK
ncbi:hypothetical protein Tco_1186486 [Tanacetum coccineum]